MVSQEDRVIIRAQRRAHQWLSLFDLAHEGDAFLVLSALLICLKENKEDLFTVNLVQRFKFLPSLLIPEDEIES